MLNAMASGWRGPKERTPKMDIFSSLDMLGNLSTDGSAGQGCCEGAHAACLAFFDGRPPSEVREVPSTIRVGRE